MREPGFEPLLVSGIRGIPLTRRGVAESVDVCGEGHRCRTLIISMCVATLQGVIDAFFGISSLTGPTPASSSKISTSSTTTTNTAAAAAYQWPSSIAR